MGPYYRYLVSFGVAGARSVGSDHFPKKRKIPLLDLMKRNRINILETEFVKNDPGYFIKADNKNLKIILWMKGYLLKTFVLKLTKITRHFLHKLKVFAFRVEKNGTLKTQK